MLASTQITVPTIPSVAVRLLELYDDPEVELHSVVELLQSDPALTAKIIAAANSPAYGVGREVYELKQAVSLLGKAIVTPLVLSFSLAEKSMPSQAAAELFRQYWLQAVVQAIAAECLAKRYAKSKVGEWFVAGLLSSIGRLAFINHDADAYRAVMEHAAAARVPLHVAEQQLLETTTVELSADLLRDWNLPERWVSATANQIRMVEQLEGLPPEGIPDQQLFVCVAAASAVGAYFCSSCQGEAFIRIMHLLEEGFGAREEDVTSLLELVKERVEDVSHLFQVSSSDLISPMQLTTLANQHLVRMAVEQALEKQHRETVDDVSTEERRCLMKRIERLMKRASTDSLTGVHNRGYFDDRFSEQIAGAIAQRKAIGLLFVDVDHFKAINDEHGHQAGDSVLRQVATVLKDAVRSNDVVARYGGEEFVVMLNKPNSQGLELLGERLRAAIEQTRITHAGRQIPVTVSVGAAMGHPVSLLDGFSDRLIAAADEAMYRAKQNGRNRVVVADPARSFEADRLAPVAG